MNRNTTALVAALLCVGACSIINAPDDLKPVPDGNGAVDAGGKNTSGKGNTSGGTSAQGGDGTTAQGGAGAETSVGGCGPDCNEGGAPPLGRQCMVSGEDCGSTAPICDATAGSCRACQSDPECHRETGKSFCVTSGTNAGRCVVCKTNADCSGKTGVCTDAGLCRACASDDECDSGVCDASGACGTDADTVYALAETGVTNGACGTMEKPCAILNTAAALLSATRNNLVFVKTTKNFTDPLTLPALSGIRVIGNGVGISPFSGASAITVPAGASVTFDNVVVSGSTADGAGGIVCKNATITVADSTLHDNAAGVLATDCDVTVSTSLIQHNNVPWHSNSGAIVATCSAANCGKNVTLLRNKFLDNGSAMYIYQTAKASIENNLFLRNGATGYVRVIELRADQTHFAYNTLVENFNTCTYVGIVACNAGTCTEVGNISFDNFPVATAGQACTDQVWYGGTMSYNLTEVPYPGTANKSGDPKFVDAAKGDYTPGTGSPAIDKGDPKDVPPFDLNGNKRPLGAGPDIGAIESQ